MNILVSACLLGVACRYDGKSKPCEQILNLANEHTLIPFCPEIYGGLPTPRKKSEIFCDKVLREDGADVSSEYKNGAAEALRICKLLNCTAAILKSKSPSCGKGKIYDGTFSGNLINGDGITAKLLINNGISVFTEDEQFMPFAQN